VYDLKDFLSNLKYLKWRKLLNKNLLRFIRLWRIDSLGTNKRMDMAAAYVMPLKKDRFCVIE
jgi:hypothetical protein